MIESVDEIYMSAQIEINELLRKNPSQSEVLRQIFKEYRRGVYHERKVELLKQYCKEHNIIGTSEDLELYNSSSATFEFNDTDLVKELEEYKLKVKEITAKLKTSTNTKKINNKTIAIKKSKEVTDNIKKVQ